MPSGQARLGQVADVALIIVSREIEDLQTRRRSRAGYPRTGTTSFRTTTSSFSRTAGERELSGMQWNARQDQAGWSAVLGGGGGRDVGFERESSTLHGRRLPSPREVLDGRVPSGQARLGPGRGRCAHHREPRDRRPPDAPFDLERYPRTGLRRSERRRPPSRTAGRRKLSGTRWKATRPSWVERCAWGAARRPRCCLGSRLASRRLASPRSLGPLSAAVVRGASTSSGRGSPFPGAPGLGPTSPRAHA